MAYTPNDHHRNLAYAGIKSQWIIPLPDEFECYSLANRNEWFAGQSYWGLYVVEDKPRPLGVTPVGGVAPEQVYVAKFVGDAHDNWHGYPVATWLKPWDKPCESVLSEWLKIGYINKPTFAKLKRSKRCAL